MYVHVKVMNYIMVVCLFIGNMQGNEIDGRPDQISEINRQNRARAFFCIVIYFGQWHALNK